MQSKIMVRIGVVLILAVGCWLLLSKGLALTNEERIQMLRAKFIQAEISQETYIRLLEKYKGASASTKPEKTAEDNLNKQLILRLYCDKARSNLVVGCDDPSPIDKIPSRVGCFLSQDPSGALKLFIRFKDKDGEVFQTSFRSYLTGFWGGIKSPGQIIEKHLSPENLEYVMDCGVVKNLLPDPPMALDSFLIYNRKPFSQTLVIDDITFDGQLVEDFDSGRTWKIRTSGPEFHCKVSLGNAKEEVASFVSTEKLTFKAHPSVCSNLVENGIYFHDSDKNGELDGWYRGKAQHMPRDSDGEMYRSLDSFGGTCEVEERGHEGLPCITITAAKGKWCGIDTLVKKIRPRTPYTISFWCRQSGPGALNVLLFGTKLTVRMFENNPDHWCRYSETVYSGSHSGSIPIGFHVIPGRTVSLSDIRLYEGNCPIGYDRAELRTHYYSQWYISPDAISPVNFGLEVWFFQDPEHLRLIIDLPPDISLAGYWLNFWGDPAKYMKRASLKKKEILREGRKYVRHHITYKSPRNFTVASVYADDMRTKKRDFWEGQLGDYAGPVNLRLFLSTKLTSQPQDELSAYYHAEWLGGKQPERKITFKVVKIPEVPRPKRLQIIYSTESADDMYVPESLNNYIRVGVTGLRTDFDKKRIQYLRDAGFKDILFWTNLAQYHPFHVSYWRKLEKDPEIHGVGLDGKRGTKKLPYGSWPAPGFCLSYRGRNWTEMMDKYKSYVSAGINHLGMDDRAYSNCYCEKCKANFKEFLKKYTNLPYKDPTTFMRKLGSDPEYESLWKDFQCWLYGMAVRDIKNELRKFAQEKGIESEIFIDSSSFPENGVVQHDFAYDMLHKHLDSWIGQYYLNCYWHMGRGDPGGLADRIAKNWKNTGKYPLKKRPHLGAGLVYMTPTCAIDPPQQHKYQILETAMCCPFTGYSLYAQIELCDLYYGAQAHKMLFPFENILIDGKMIDNITVVSETNRSRARGKRLGKDILLLVSDYSTYGSEKTVVMVTLPPSLKVLQDVETKEKIESEGDGSFIVSLKNGRRARLFQGSAAH